MSGVNSSGYAVVLLILCGIIVFVLTLLLFLFLKVCNIISWGWIWVLSPGWILFGIIAATYGIMSLKYGKK